LSGKSIEGGSAATVEIDGLSNMSVETVRLPPKSRIKESCLDRLILVGEPSLRRAVREFVTHYHEERNHQGLGNVLILPARDHTPVHEGVVCRQRLGGLLKYYHRPAA
jgi:hypothetical protein